MDESTSPEDLASDLSAALAGARVSVERDGSRVHVEAVGEIFAGLTKVKRQQLVYKMLRQKIASGEIHALTMTTLAPGESG